MSPPDIVPEARRASPVPEARRGSTVPEARQAGTVPEARRAGTVPEARQANTTDLDIVGGRLLDPAQGIDARTTISVRGGRIAGVGDLPAATPDLPRPAPPTLLLTP